MTLSASIYILLISLFASIVFNGFFRNIANNNKILIDLPDKSRKFHARATPLTGGISIFAACLLSTFLLEGLSDLTGIHVQTNINNEILQKDNNFLNQNMSKKYQVNEKNYEVLIDINQNPENLSVEVISENMPGSSSLKIIPMPDNQFEVILPDSSSSVYKYNEGEVTKIASGIQPLKTSSIENFGISVDFFSFSLLFCGTLLIIFMIFDDIKGIKASYRLLFQATLALLVVLMTGVALADLGDIFGFGVINLGYFSTIFTVFCIVGLINAFNMSDGLNGICASFGMIPLVMIMLFSNAQYGLLVPIGALLGFLIYNLGYFGKKRSVFLGDHGSNAIGFLIAMVLISASQVDQTINPVTALWLVALPLLDCLGVIISRILKGIQPFRPGRDHLHHKLLDIGFSSESILGIFILSTVVLSSIGFGLEFVYPSKEYLSFYLFILFTSAYFVFIKTKLTKNAKHI